MVSAGRTWIGKSSAPGKAIYLWIDTLTITIAVSTLESAVTQYTGFPPSATVLNQAAWADLLETIGGDLVNATDGMINVNYQYTNGLFIKVARTLAPASTRNVTVLISAFIEDAE